MFAVVQFPHDGHPKDPGPKPKERIERAVVVAMMVKVDARGIHKKRVWNVAKSRELPSLSAGVHAALPR
jgi:hypothetical protein